MFTVRYCNFGQAYTDQLTRSAAIDELIYFGVPYTDRQLKSMSDKAIGKLLDEIYRA